MIKFYLFHYAYKMLALTAIKKMKTLLQKPIRMKLEISLKITYAKYKQYKQSTQPVFTSPNSAKKTHYSKV